MPPYQRWQEPRLRVPIVKEAALQRRGPLCGSPEVCNRENSSPLWRVSSVARPSVPGSSSTACRVCYHNQVTSGVLPHVTCQAGLGLWRRRLAHVPPSWRDTLTH